MVSLVECRLVLSKYLNNVSASRMHSWTKYQEVDQIVRGNKEFIPTAIRTRSACVEVIIKTYVYTATSLTMSRHIYCSTGIYSVFSTP